MVAEGETLTAVPLVTEMLPGVITPVPPEKTPVRLEVDPAAIVPGLAVKLAIDGPAETVTVAVCETDCPPVPVTMSV